MSRPFFSIVTPVYNPPAPVLEAMLASVHDQTFADWEHCLVDDCSTEPHVRQILDRAARADSRIRVHYRSENGSIVAASNDGLGMATGEFIALLDHDDEYAPEALSKAHHVLVHQPDVDYLYTDEDKIDEQGRKFGPFTKPAWSPERLRSHMYTCHLSVLRRSLVEEVGGFHADYNGSQDWDLVLRVTERAREIAHIPEVLYHWRLLEGSAAGDPTAKPWAYTAGVKAIQSHCDRIGFQAEATQDETIMGLYHLRPKLTSQPLVSIIIPTGGQVRDIRGERKVLVHHCVETLLQRSTYENYELIVVVDERTDAAVIDTLRTLAGDRLTLVTGKQPFNFSERINLGALAADGDHLLLLNDDIEVRSPDWIERMVMYSSSEGIGAVGAKLLFPDGRLQHVGVIFDHGTPYHLYRGFSGEYPGYYADVLVANNYLAVTGACLMSSREAFESVGGFSTLLPLNYNDIDYCLKLQAEGLRVAWDPDTILYHFESSTRELDVASVEREAFERRWAGTVAHDPYLTPSMLLPSEDFVRHEPKIGAVA